MTLPIYWPIANRLQVANLPHGLPVGWTGVKGFVGWYGVKGAEV